jgi:glutamate-1-semialdehyde 2,1-aminomutase
VVTNSELFERAQQVIPGGVNSPVRAFRSVGGTPYFVARAEGAHIWDVEGHRFVDYVQSYGASILGHADAEVVAAIRAAAKLGTTYGAPTEGEVLLAEELCRRVSGLEQVRLVSSGTEATMSALRLARGVTGRDRIVKFAGNYHGHSDSLLVAGGSGIAQSGLLGSDGVTQGAIADTIVAPYNVVPELDERIAAVIVEPVAANMGLVPPVEGFLAGLRRACDAVGALLIFDEVITGCRLAPGGGTEWSGVVPDMWCFGKVIGGGLPIGAFGASAEIMSHLAPLGGVYQAGTLSGNPVATAAGLTVLRRLDAFAYDRLNQSATELAAGLEWAFAESGIEVVIPRVGGLVGLFFGSAAPQNYDEATAAVNAGRYREFFHGMLERGIALAPGAYEVMFPSLAHDAEDLDATVAAAHSVAADLAR